MVLVSITYIYFLIFAQFAFLDRLALLGIAATSLKIVMAAMAMSGIAFSLATSRVRWLLAPSRALRFSLTACGVAALCSTLPLNLSGAISDAALIGAGLGVLTVTLVANLREWMGQSLPLLKVGIGTGLGYFLCNVPAIFTASPEHRAEFAALLCFVAMIVTMRGAQPAINTPSSLSSTISFPSVLTAFTALVWLDSAAFYIIQHTPLLKAGTWSGNQHLWLNAIVHLSAAIATACILQKGRVRLVLGASFCLLGFACVLLLHPETILPASLLYPVGVSFYSVALVAYPSFIASASTPSDRLAQAGWLYAVAGWAASALGIGMGQNLGYVPLWFVALAGAAVVLPMMLSLARTRVRELGAVALVAVIAGGAYQLVPSEPRRQPTTSVERGRQVYISEGCIHCHSQYVRPHTQDEVLWGPSQSIDSVRLQRPPLIGNRRQGPDLSQVGARRSPLWLKMHLIDPEELGGAVMPSYAFLFQDGRGNDLVNYLVSLRAEDHPQSSAAQNWQLPAEVYAQANAEDGAQLYTRFCATCHDESGRDRREWRKSFRKAPPDLFTNVQSATLSDPMRLARIVKFGLPQSDMPGHEYFSDLQVAALTKWLQQHSASCPHAS